MQILINPYTAVNDQLSKLAERYGLAWTNDKCTTGMCPLLRLMDESRIYSLLFPAMKRGKSTEVLIAALNERDRTFLETLIVQNNWDTSRVKLRVILA